MINTKDEPQDSEFQYRSILDFFGDALNVVDENLIIKYINPALKQWIKVLNLDGNPMGKSLLEAFPFLSEKVRNEYNQVFNSGKTLITEEVNNIGNKKLITEIRKIPIFSNGKVKQVIAVIRNITEQKTAEQKLKESEEKYRSFIENFKGIAFQGYQDFSIGFFHGDVLEITGFSKEDFTSGKIKWNQIIHPDDLLNYNISIDDYHSTSKKMDEREYRIINKDGKIIWVLETNTKFYDNLQQMEGVRGTIIDISERKKAEQKLKKSEVNYRQLFEATPYSIVLVDLKGVIVDCNPAVESLIGMNKDELIGKNFLELDIYEKDGFDILKNEYHEFLKVGHKNIPIELQIKKKNGEYVWVDLEADFVKRGDQTLIQAVLKDISIRKNTEQRVKESEERFSTAFYMNSNLMALSNLEDGTFMEVNDSFLETIQTTREEIIGKSAKILYSDPKDRDFLIEQLKKKGKVVNYELKFKTINGDPKIGLFSFDLVEMDGKPRLISVAKDITDRKIAEKKLKESEERFRTLYENMPGGTIILGEDCVIKDVNSRTCDITGYIKEELIGKKCDIICPKGSQNCQIWSEGVEGFQGKDTELICKNGKKIPILKNAKKIKLDEKIHILENFQDITEKKKAEDVLIRINKLKSDIFTRASHELKTPLISIKGYTDLLLELHRDEFDGIILSSLNQIKSGCTVFEKTINDILNATYLETDHVKLNISREDLSFLINYCVSDLEGLALTRNHEITVDIHDNLITTIEKERIYEVLSNLIINAIKYTPPGGEIEVKSEIADNFYIISVKDSGIGFTEEEKEHLFTQFGKIERYGQGWDLGIEGTGLGLYICKRIVETHGGQIWVESEGRDKGSTFHFSLPIIKD